MGLVIWEGIPQGQFPGNSGFQTSAISIYAVSASSELAKRTQMQIISATGTLELLLGGHLAQSTQTKHSNDQQNGSEIAFHGNADIPFFCQPFVLISVNNYCAVGFLLSPAPLACHSRSLASQVDETIPAPA